MEKGNVEHNRPDLPPHSRGSTTSTKIVQQSNPWQQSKNVQLLQRFFYAVYSENE